ADTLDLSMPYYLYFQHPEHTLFTENETNRAVVFGDANNHPYKKDAINTAVIANDFKLFKGKTAGTKVSPFYKQIVQPGEKYEVRLRLSAKEFSANPLKEGFENIFSERIKEADGFYSQFLPEDPNPELEQIQRQAFAGMLWTKQYYNIDVNTWLKGDPVSPPPNRIKEHTRNRNWKTLNNEDIISMPDKWEYPWYAAWDLAFHCVPLAMLDANFAKEQLILFLREWYMKPNGQIPAYEWSFGDVNPPVHAWACVKVYQLDKQREGKGDIDFLKRVFHKLLINFTWWVNSKDRNNNNVFEGGFLGLDNIGPFDRSSNIPGGGFLEQADGTSWMALYCLNMLDMALEIAQVDPTYEDTATKFLEHFVYIAESLNKISEDWIGAWDEEDGFFYDILVLPDEDEFIPLKVRSLVGLTSFFATLLIEEERLDAVPKFKERMLWFRNYRMQNGLYVVMEEFKDGNDVLLSLLPRKRLTKMLKALLDEEEFYSPRGIRSLSKKHEEPYTFKIKNEEFSIKYEPGESTTTMYGGNSNWRGPVWFPVNYILIDALRIFSSYYGDSLQVECPTGSHNEMTLDQVADKISKSLVSIFRKDEQGHRPVNDQSELYQNDPHFKDLILFFEYFHGDNGRGLGAAHQTGWTGVVAQLIDHCGWER
ncbi:MAG: glucosidase, partial [Bacteroidota bacterium]